MANETQLTAAKQDKNIGSLNVPLSMYCAANFPFIWLQTDEYSEAMLDSIVAIMRTDKGRAFYRWSVAGGMTRWSIPSPKGDPLIEKLNTETMTMEADPRLPLLFMKALLNKGGVNCPSVTKEMKHVESRPVIFLYDYHLYINQHFIWRDMLDMIDDLGDRGACFVIVSPSVQVPLDMKSYISVCKYNLPTQRELENIAEYQFNTHGIEQRLPNENGVVPNTSDGIYLTVPYQEVARHGLGMTRYEFTQSLCLCISGMGANGGKFDSRLIQSQKEAKLAQDGLIQTLKSTKTFSDICGMDNAKNFIKDMVESMKGRGTLLLGVPGCGKTLLASALGNETNRPVLVLDFGLLMGSLVGQTETRTEMALQMVDAMQPCILFVDELEKSLAGAGSASGDSGTSKRQGSYFLKWLSDHTSDVYVVATANNVDDLPPEYLRAERWDATFFVDIPDTNQQAELRKMYSSIYGIEDTPEVDLNNWTGAEIKTAFRIANARNCSLKNSMRFVVPVYRSAQNMITRLREQASTFAINANDDDYVEDDNAQCDNSSSSVSGGTLIRKNTPAIKFAEITSSGLRRD